MMISATKVNVASQTMCQTAGTSPGWITPVARATPAPAKALHPIPRPLGCQMTKTRVARKMASASIRAVSSYGSA